MRRRTPIERGSPVAAGRCPTFPGGTPRREALDALVPDRPVMLYNRDGHGVWVNSLALAAGRRGAPPPPIQPMVGSSAIRMARPPACCRKAPSTWWRTTRHRRATPITWRGCWRASASSTGWASPAGRTPSSGRMLQAAYAEVHRSGRLTARRAAGAAVGQQARPRTGRRAGRAPRRGRGRWAGGGQRQALRGRHHREPHGGHGRAVPGSGRPPERRRAASP